MELAIAIVALVLVFLILFFVISMLYFAVRYVPYVPSSTKATEVMLEAVPLSEGKRVYDLGCGDGRLIRSARRKYKANATGFEISPFVYLWAKIKNIVTNCNADIRLKNFFKVNLSDAEVVYCYLFPGLMQKLKRKFQEELKPGTIIISNSFKIRGWEEVKMIPTIEGKPESFLVRVYIMGENTP